MTHFDLIRAALNTGRSVLISAEPMSDERFQLWLTEASRTKLVLERDDLERKVSYFARGRRRFDECPDYPRLVAVVGELERRDFADEITADHPVKRRVA